MAVIDTSMNMPKGCLKCEYHDDVVGFCRKIKRYTNACFSETDKNPHCPLKSTDEMIAEIKEEYFDVYVFAREVTERTDCYREIKDGNDD